MIKQIPQAPNVGSNDASNPLYKDLVEIRGVVRQVIGWVNSYVPPEAPIDVPAHASTHASGGSDPVTPAAIGAAAAGSGVPPGAVMAFAMHAPPTGWLACKGQTVSRTTYPELFAAIGTTYGVGDGSTTFGLPELRGEFIRGWDDGRGIDSGRTLGSAQGDAIRNISGAFTGWTGVNPSISASSVNGAIYTQYGIGNGYTWIGGPYYGTTFNFDASRVVPTAAENRPRNIVLMYCIKT